MRWYHLTDAMIDREKLHLQLSLRRGEVDVQRWMDRRRQQAVGGIQDATRKQSAAPAFLTHCTGSAWTKDHFRLKLGSYVRRQLLFFLLYLGDVAYSHSGCLKQRSSRDRELGQNR